MDTEKLRTVTLDLETLTLGEGAEAERQSGQSLASLLTTTMGRKTLALFVDGLRSSDPPPSWQELSSLRLLDVSPSSSRGQKVSRSET